MRSVVSSGKCISVLELNKSGVRSTTKFSMVRLDKLHNGQLEKQRINQNNAARGITSRTKSSNSEMIITRSTRRRTSASILWLREPCRMPT